MTRFERTPTPGIYTAIVLSMVVVFIVDLLTPLGYAEWVVYLVPVILTLFVWRQSLPLFVAGATTLLMVAGLLLSPAGVSMQTAAVNRSLGLVTVWVVAFVGYQFIRNKIAVRRQQWLQTGETGLNTAIAGTPTLALLGEHVLKFLAEYLDAHAGALFVQEGDGFRRIAAMRCRRATPRPSALQSGEGLLGQAAQDGRAFVVRDVPEGYLAIGSAPRTCHARATCSSPRSPPDGEVNAVIELGFFHPVDGA